MIDALGRPQSLLLLGGTSEIALAVARAWSDALPVVTLAARPGARRDEAAAGLRADGFEVEVDFDVLFGLKYKKKLCNSTANDSRAAQQSQLISLLLIVPGYGKNILIPHYNSCWYCHKG